MWGKRKHWIKNNSSHILYFSDAQIYMDHHNYMINDITAIQIFATENPVTFTNMKIIIYAHLTNEN